MMFKNQTTVSKNRTINELNPTSIARALIREINREGIIISIGSHEQGALGLVAEIREIARCLPELAVILAAAEPRGIDNFTATAKSIGISRGKLYRIVEKFESMGILLREEDGKVILNPRFKNLRRAVR